jgi:dimethylhistidine N-methyltransferase
MRQAVVPVANGRLTLIDADGGLPSRFASDVRRGLTASRKRLSCRYFYDAEGSALFERICGLTEYYLTRTELAILRRHGDAVVRSLSADAVLVELGSGSATKTRVLLERALVRNSPVRYVPIDISRSMLEASSRALLDDYAGLEITAIAAEYRAGLRWLTRQCWPQKLILWLGSNVGNFARNQATRFLRDVRAAMTARDRLLVGIDLRKPRELLEAAYDDAEGVTAAFNKNILSRINRELGGHFDVDMFRHRAVWNDSAGRVEMHLQSTREQHVRIDALALRVRFARGESIFTESSYKYSLDEIDRLAAACGLSVESRWLDAGARFSVNLLAQRSG